MKESFKFILAVMTLLLIACTAQNELVQDEYLSSYKPDEIIVDDTTTTNDEDVNNNYLLSENKQTESSLLQERIFVGQRRLNANSNLDFGGDGEVWYTRALGWKFYSLTDRHVELAGTDLENSWELVNMWIDTLRDANGIPWGTIRDFIDYFDLVVDDFIAVEEAVHGMPMSEADKIILWAREIAAIPFVENYIDEDGNNAFDWRFWPTSAEIRALFSDNVYEIWESHPGYGVVRNGNIYSPEWIVQNLEQAILEEGIPIDDIERILTRAIEHPALQMEVELAMVELISVMSILENR